MSQKLKKEAIYVFLKNQAVECRELDRKGGAVGRRTRWG